MGGGLVGWVSRRRVCVCVHACVCVCVCVHVRTRARVCANTHVCAFFECLLMQEMLDVVQA